MSCHPQPESPAPEPSSILTTVADVVPIRYSAEPDWLTLPLNWMKAESFVLAFLSALPRTQRR